MEHRVQKEHRVYPREILEHKVQLVTRVPQELKEE